MFNLEQSVSDWRSQMLAARIPQLVVDELESHLRELILTLIAAGKSEADAFAAATQSLGSTATLKNEFKKLNAANCIPSLGWAAWIIFVIAFFVPAYNDGLGWQCAGLSVTCITWQEFKFNLENWSTMLLFLMTPANVVMAVSPFLVSKLSRRPVAFKWLRAVNLAALVLVWTYFVLLLTDLPTRGDLRIGCYLWAASFLLFSFSLFRFRAPRKVYARS